MVPTSDICLVRDTNSENRKKAFAHKQAQLITMHNQYLKTKFVQLKGWLSVGCYLTEYLILCVRVLHPIQEDDALAFLNDLLKSKENPAPKK